MKSYFIVFIMVLSLVSSLFGFIDEEEESRELLIRKLDELKVIKGVLLSGRGKVFFDAGKGSGKDFEAMGKKLDYTHILQLDLNFFTRPLDILEGGGVLRFESDFGAEG